MPRGGTVRGDHRAQAILSHAYMLAIGRQAYSEQK